VVWSLSPFDEAISHIFKKLEVIGVKDPYHMTVSIWNDNAYKSFLSYKRRTQHERP